MKVHSIFRQGVIILFLILIASYLIGCGGGGGGGGGAEDSTQNPTGNIGSVVTESVSLDGGTISHSKGFTVLFPENCLSSPTTISLEDVAIPASLPFGTTASSLAFKASPDGIKFDIPVKISFSNISSLFAENPEELCIFRWNGTAWTSLGTIAEDNSLSAFTEGFSIFVTGKPEDIWKKFEFFNFGNQPARLIPWTWALNNTLFNTYPFNVSVNVPGAPYNQTGPTAWLPQGCYTFCYEFNLYDVNTWSWVIVHNFKGVEWDTCLSQYDSLVVPPLVFIDTTYGYQNGPCPAPPGPAGGGGGNGGNGGGGGGGGISIAGTWPASATYTSSIILDDGTVYASWGDTYSWNTTILQEGSNFTLTLQSSGAVISGSIDGNTVSGSVPWYDDDYVNTQCPPIGMGGTIAGSTLTLSGSGSCRKDEEEETHYTDAVIVVTLSE
jgi:hypothetical protein